MPNCCLIPQRYILVTMTWLSLVIITAIASSIVLMLYEITVSAKGMKYKGNVCLREQHSAQIPKDFIVITHINETVKYKWSTNVKKFMLSTSTIGQLLTNIPSGMFADKCGGKWILALNILLIGCISITIPTILVLYDATGLVIARLFLSCCQGCTIPVIYSLLSRWIPFHERARTCAIINTGFLIGNQFGYILPKFINTDTWTHVEQVYYFWGMFSILWFIIFVIFCYSDPISHPFINHSEVEYLEYSLVDIRTDRKLLNIPWTEIFTSGPMRAYYVALISHIWFFNMFNYLIPKYYIDILRYTYTEALFQLIISNTVMMFISIISGFICDWLIQDKIIGITRARKFLTISAFAGAAIFLILASFADCFITAANCLLTISMILYGPYFAGMNLNILDLAPNYSGTITGVACGITTLLSIFVYPFSDIIISNNDLAEWRLVYWLTFFILCTSALYVGIAASGRVQEWNEPDYNATEKNSHLLPLNHNKQ